MEFFEDLYFAFCPVNQDQSMNILDVMGIIETDQEVLLSSALPAMGWTTIIISVILAVAFYIWPINHPRFKSWWSWLIMLGADIVINFILTFFFIKSRVDEINDYPDGEALDELGVSAGDYLEVATRQCLDLAFANIVVAIIFFCAASLCLTWFSSNAKYSPIRK